MTFVVRPFEPRDARGVCALFETVHKRPLPEELRAWRFRDAAEFVGEADGSIVAHLGVIRQPIERDGERLDAGLWADLMIHPAHRGLPGFLALCDAAHEAPFEAMWAFPNDNSFPLIKKLYSWSDNSDFPALEGPARPARPALPVETRAPSRAEADALWARLKPRDRWCVVNDHARLERRYLSKPGAPYAFFTAERGWACAKTFGDVLDILDLWAADDATADALFAAAQSHFPNARTVSAWNAPTRWGLAPSAAKTHFITKPALAGWRLAKGDSDVF